MDGSIAHSRNLGQALPQGQGLTTSAPRFGVVVLDSCHANQGWACTGDIPPERIKSIAALQSDTIWWVGLDFMTFRSRGITANNGTLRYDQWFGVTQKTALGELGSGDTLGTGSTSAATLGGVLMNIKEILDLLAASQGQPASSVFRPYALSKGLNHLTGSKPQISQGMLRKFEGGNALSANIIRTGAAQSSSQTVKFFKPRLAYALDLLNTPVPKSPVERVIPPVPDPISFIKNATMPLIADITVTRAHPKTASIFALSQNDRHGGLPRTTATLSEILALAEFASLDVHNIWAGDGYVRAIDTLPTSVKSFLNDPGCAYSWSAGVVAKELVKGLIGPHQDKAGNPTITWLGLWLKAQDRLNCYNSALHLTNLGFTATMYGLGRLDIFVPKSPGLDISLLTAALRLGYLPEPGAYSEDVLKRAFMGDYGPAAPEDGWGAAAFFVETFLTGRGDLIRAADRAPLLDDAEQRDLFVNMDRQLTSRQPKAA